jgi:hypothetical protein
MKKTLLLLCVIGWSMGLAASAAVITVNTTNNLNPAAGEISLLQALTNLQDGDEVRFNIPGPGPHYIQTPESGYPFIRANNVLIDGYSQPGAAANTNSIRAANVAQIRIVLDSRNGGHRAMSFIPTAPNDDIGYSSNDGAVLGILDGRNFRVRGVSFLGVPDVGSFNNVFLSFISFARGASGQIDGCWLGVAPDGQTVAGAAAGITGLRYRGRDAGLNTTNTILTDAIIIGVAPEAANAAAQFNVIAGITDSPVIIEGNNTRISGNFIGVLPSGLEDYNVSMVQNLSGRFQSAIAIGQSGNNTLIGTDGDGVNDENERNVFGGALPFEMGGTRHLIDFYRQNPGTNVVIAGNYFGVGVDGTTRFTNGVPILNASGPEAQYRIGSDFDGASDALEANLVSNNYPPQFFAASSVFRAPEDFNFLTQLNAQGTVSLRGNSLINNFPFPTSPALDGGFFWVSYYSKALLDPESGVTPVLSTNSTRTRLIGTAPVPEGSVYSITTLDVYIADQEGMTNTVALAMPEFPQGFVQGRTYLGSFVVDSTADRDPAPGAFDFDMAHLNVAQDTQLTVTANYSGTGRTETSDPIPLIINRTANTVTISWVGSGFVLQSTPQLDGLWTEEPTTGNSLTIVPSERSRFFRLEGAGGGSIGGAPGVLTSPFSNVIRAF